MFRHRRYSCNVLSGRSCVFLILFIRGYGYRFTFLSDLPCRIYGYFFLGYILRYPSNTAVRCSDRVQGSFGNGDMCSSFFGYA